MADLLKLSSEIIDQGVVGAEVGPINRITQELSELAPDLAVIESFSHVVCFRTAAGLLLFDTSGKFSGEAVVSSLRRWSEAPVHSVVYTHGHVDHVGGAAAFAADAVRRGHSPARVIGHENVVKRFERYERTNGYNLHINRRQFSGGASLMPELFLPAGTPEPNVTFADRLALEVGELRVELRHAKGETDDHLWAWLPARKILCAGDFFIWNFPNAGNPQKVQRYPLEWAQALRAMAAQGAELFIPAHGLPIAGEARIQRVLVDVADTLEKLVEDTLALMNQGATLDTILHEVTVDPAALHKPYLRPLYDEPEFVVRNVFRLYGGWYDGNPARLKPPRDSELARELAALAGGAPQLVTRARALAEGGELRLACQLVELAVQAAPEDKDAHHARYEIYLARRRAESSLMAKGIYGTAAADSFRIAHPGEPSPITRAKGYAI
ncbi:MAG TPA: alkyl sulfatase dimerization domain-containing protein [Polyangiales bacterium]|nr:alkyl sulfatase dimerization domain-containing protein [Polyangiales bacterium]